VADLKNCNSTIFFEARKHKDLYLWLAKTPNGPSAKFLVQNIYTMAEVKLTGNCLKGSRPLLVFDSQFDSSAAPHYRLLKEMFTQIFGAPKGHPRIKPFIDHVIAFYIADNRIWFRNYQIVYEPSQEQLATAAAQNRPIKSKEEPVLVEIGPRFVLNPVKIFGGSFGGGVLWENPHYISPNTLRAIAAARKGSKYDQRQMDQEKTAQHKEAAVIEPNPLDAVFEQEISNKIKESNRKRQQNAEEEDEEEEEEEELEGSEEEELEEDEEEEDEEFDEDEDESDD
jgi:ribosome biogenesis protein BRX1